MDDQTKIHLSPYEAGLLSNSEWILTKNTIIKKAKWLLEEVQQNIFDYTRLQSTIFPKEVITISPKISKGENYKGLPWLMLDYPRYFDKENIFAIRIMFWWGNFFSTTLHLSGHYKQKYHQAIIHSYEDLHKNEFYLCINDEQWDHHFEKENSPHDTFELRCISVWALVALGPPARHDAVPLRAGAPIHHY